MKKLILILFFAVAIKGFARPVFTTWVYRLDGDKLISIGNKSVKKSFELRRKDSNIGVLHLDIGVEPTQEQLDNLKTNIINLKKEKSFDGKIERYLKEKGLLEKVIPETIQMIEK